MAYKVLSIDFDYFQTVHPDIISTCYPDGIDVDTKTSIFRWLNAYANAENAAKMNSVTINQDEINLLKELLLHQKTDCPAMVANSHKNIYEFVNSLMCKQVDTTPLVITNVDMHHDFSNDNYELDCGNWVSHLADKYTKFGFEWIANPISKGIYGFTKDEGADIIKETLNSISSRNYDAVFLCRSDPWFPPHLDDAFDDILSVMKSHFSEIDIEKDISKPRNYTYLLKKETISKKHNKTEREY